MGDNKKTYSTEFFVAEFAFIPTGGEVAFIPTGGEVGTLEGLEVGNKDGAWENCCGTWHTLMVSFSFFTPFKMDG